MPDQTQNTQHASDTALPRVLLAEDYVTNQEVTTQLLENAGVHVDIAGNGREALEMFTRLEYGLVLMDIQMPEMDGFEATRAIRKYESENESAPTPVIAITAHAIKGYRDKCLDAGMNDYLTKPLRRIELLGMLAKWMPSRQSPDITVSAGAFDLQAAQQDFDDDMTFYFALADDFLSELPGLFSQLGACLENAQAGQARYDAHRLKRRAERLQAAPLAETLGELENFARDRLLPEAEAALRDAEIKIRELAADLEAAKAEALAQEAPFSFETAVQEFEGAEDIVIRLVRNFLPRLTKDLEEFETFLAEQDAESIRSKAHAIKGGAANLCMAPLSQKARRLEMLAREGDLENATQALTRLQEEFIHLKNYIDEHIPQMRDSGSEE